MDDAVDGVFGEGLAEGPEFELLVGGGDGVVGWVGRDVGERARLVSVALVDQMGGACFDDLGGRNLGVP